ncbi:hypothetical protein BST61_g4308 [Cercospora zeina]
MHYRAACYKDKERIVQVLLDAGADVNADGGRYGNALQAACFNDRERIVQVLLDAGADVNAHRGPYSNALQAACHGGNEHVVQILLDAGAAVNAPGGFSGNALQAACVRGHERVVQMLLDAGADVNAQGGFDGTALVVASYEANELVVEMLIAAGADVNAAAKMRADGHANALEVATKELQRCRDSLTEARGGDCKNEFDFRISNEEMVARQKAYKNIVKMLEDAGVVLPEDNESDQGSLDISEDHSDQDEANENFESVTQVRVSRSSTLDLLMPSVAARSSKCLPLKA